MKVIIKAGTYGWRNARGILEPKHAGDIVEVTDAQWERLRLAGIAEPVTEKADAPAPDPSGEVPPAAPADEDPETEGGAYDREALQKLTVAELRELCVGAGMSKEAAKKATKAVCLDFLAPLPEIPDDDDIIL